MAAKYYVTAVHFLAMSAILYLLVIERNYRNSQIHKPAHGIHDYPDNNQDSPMSQNAARMKRTPPTDGLSDEIDNLQAMSDTIDNKLTSDLAGGESVGLEGDDPYDPVDDISDMDNFTTKMVPGVTLTNAESVDAFRLPTLNDANQESSKKFTIGLYCFYHGGIRFQASHVNMDLCQYSQCSVKFIQQTGIGPYDVDAMMFQGNHIPPQLPIYRRPDQAFVFFSSESPQHLRYMDSGSNWLQDYFNWTMTYRLDSDIPYPYGRIVPSGSTSLKQNGGYSEDPELNKYAKIVYDNPGGIVKKDYEKVFKRKTKHAAWLVSHCNTVSKREDYVKEMQTNSTIDIFGACTNRACHRKDPNCERVIEKEYKFYMAFENSICKDYITEKAYKWFDKDILVVVRGARNYPVHLPVGTFIDADDFKTPGELALYLNNLAADKDEYIRMLKRKDNYRLVWHTELIQNAYCMLCERLHNVDRYRKVVPDIHEWWTKDICEYP